MKRAEHTNFPFHVCSLTTVIRREAEKRSVVTKSREGNCGNDRMTRNQSEWRGECAGRRKTNNRRHRKGEPAEIADRAGCIWVRRPSVLCGKSAIIKEENGQMHLMTRRCKRRRHVWKDSLSTWGEPAWSRQRVNESIRRNAEIWTDAMQGVGDGHISQNGKDNTTLPMRRAISLRTCPEIREGQRMNAEMAQKHPVKRVKVNRRAIYSSANANETKFDDCGMRKKESQGESRTWENRISSSVGGVKAIPLVRSAFTLIELLLVVAVIGILVSLLLPTLKTAKDKANQIACQGNLKQLGFASQMYFNEYGCWKNKQIYWQPLRPYVDSSYTSGYPCNDLDDVYVCPSDENPHLQGGQTYSSYGQNFYKDGNGNTSDGNIRQVQIKNPSSLLWMTDSISSKYYILMRATSPAAYLSYRHTGGQTNILFFDWHVDSMSITEVQNKGGYKLSEEGAAFICPNGIWPNI